jgi:hypothetical protein
MNHSTPAGLTPAGTFRLLMNALIYSKMHAGEMVAALIRQLPYQCPITGRNIFGCYSARGFQTMATGTKSSMIRRARVYIHRHPTFDGFRLA